MPNDIKSHSMPNFRVKNLIERFGSHRMGQFREDPNHAKNHAVLCLLRCYKRAAAAQRLVFIYLLLLGSMLVVH